MDRCLTQSHSVSSHFFGGKIKSKKRIINVVPEWLSYQPHPPRTKKFKITSLNDTQGGLQIRDWRKVEKYTYVKLPNGLGVEVSTIKKHSGEYETIYSVSVIPTRYCPVHPFFSQTCSSLEYEQACTKHAEYVNKLIRMGGVAVSCGFALTLEFKDNIKSRLSEEQLKTHLAM